MTQVVATGNVEPSAKPEGPMSVVQLYVANLPWSVRASHLTAQFAEFGEVKDAFVGR